MYILRPKTEDIKEFISKEIEKSGFPLEGYSCMILDRNGWEITPHLLWYNKMGNCNNEIDVFATKDSYRKEFMGGKYLKREILVVECKKQEKKPWVFFQADEPIKEVSALHTVPPNPFIVSKTSFKNQSGK